MKKFVLILVGVLFVSKVFALSDVQISFGMDFFDRSFDVYENSFMENGNSGFAFSVSNYNFLDQKEHLGFFEKLSGTTENKGGIEILAGPAFGFDMTENTRIQFGPFFKTVFNFRQDRNLQEYYNNFDFPDVESQETLVRLGIGTEVLVKCFTKKMFNPVAGIDFSLDLYCRDFVKVDESLYHIDYEHFSQLNIRPFLGVSFTFPSKKNDCTKHDQDSKNF